MTTKIELATIKREFLKDDEADLTYVVLEKSENTAVITRLHQQSTPKISRTVPLEWLNIFDQIETNL